MVSAQQFFFFDVRATKKLGFNGLFLADPYMQDWVQSLGCKSLYTHVVLGLGPEWCRYSLTVM
jgi:hypothetical protein